MSDNVEVGAWKGVGARVGVTVGMTLQIGEFTYIKPNVSIECASPGDSLTPDELFEFLTNWALDKLESLEDKMIAYAE